MATDTSAGLRFHGDQELAPGLTDLAVNVRPGTPPAWLAERLRDAIGSVAAYPDPGPATAAVAARHGRPAAEVLVTAGAAEAFTLIARSFRPLAAVVVHPQFTEPEAALRAAGHPVRQVVLATPFRLDPAAVPEDADLVVLGNPVNPTSVLHPAAVIRSLARPGRRLVVDEAFMDCVPGEPESLATAGMAGEAGMTGEAGAPRGAGQAGAAGPAGAVPGLIVVRSLTKTWGLAGLRAGYLLADPADIAALAGPRPPWATSSLALAAIEACCAPRALAEAAAWAETMSAERDRLAADLNDLPGVTVVPAPRASFLLLHTAPASPDGPTDVRGRLRAAGFAVRRGDTFPGLGPGWLRIAVRDRATNDRFAAALGAVLRRPAEEVR